VHTNVTVPTSKKPLLSNIIVLLHKPWNWKKYTEGMDAVYFFLALTRNYKKFSTGWWTEIEKTNTVGSSRAEMRLIPTHLLPPSSTLKLPRIYQMRNSASHPSLHPSWMLDQSVPAEFKRAAHFKNKFHWSTAQQDEALR